jgi:hypothetical protein
MWKYSYVVAANVVHVACFQFDADQAKWLLVSGTDYTVSKPTDDISDLPPPVSPPLRSLAVHTPIMEVNYYAPCDLDEDGDCDPSDVELFETVLGNCADLGEGILPAADVDDDLCMTPMDQWAVFAPRDLPSLAGWALTVLGLAVIGSAFWVSYRRPLCQRRMRADSHQRR